MGVKGSGEALNKILAKAAPSHPHAYGSFGFWVIARKPAPPLGWVIARNVDGVWMLDAYAYCRDETNKRPWLKTFKTLNSAASWMMQHEREILDLIERSTPEPGDGR